LLALLAEVIEKHRLAKKNVKMNYDNYEAKIVEEYGVCLEGWPVGKVRNPGTIGGRRYVTTLLDALNSGTCYWTRLGREELKQRISDNKARAAAGEEVYKRRQARKQKAKSAEVIDDDDDDDGGDADGGNDGGNEGGNEDDGAGADVIIN
jgi:hypothetical protein